MQVLFVDDHTLFTDAIRPVLERIGMTVDTASTAAEAVASVRSSPPDLVLLDIGLPDQSGFALGKGLLEEHGSIKILALSALDDRRAVEEAVRLGFHGYLTKDVPIAQLVSGVESVLAGHLVVPHRLGPGGRRSREETDAEFLIDQLTPREREVLTLLTQGLAGESIARRLGITANTVRTHVQSILTKLQVHTRLEAAAFAVRHGLAEIPLARSAG